MRIRHLAERTGLTIDSIRYYEKQGLLDPTHVERSENGYRDFSEGAVERLEMIRHAQAAGFTLAEIRDLLGLWERNELSDDHIVAHLRAKQRQILAKIAQLDHVHQYIASKLEQYAHDGHRRAQRVAPHHSRPSDADC